MAHSNEIWLADLLRACSDLAPDDEAAGEICRQLGIAGRLPAAEIVAMPGEPALFHDDSGAAALAPEPAVPPPPPPAPRAAADAYRVFSELEQLAAQAESPQQPVWLGSTVALRAEASPPPRPPEPLLPRLQRRAILATALGVDVPEGELDLDGVVRTLTRGLPLCSLPRRPRRTLRYGVEVWVDGAPWLEPFRGDQQALVAYLRTLFPADRVTVRRCRGSPEEIRPRVRRAAHVPRPDPLAAALVLSDLGAGFRQLGVPPPQRGQWRRHARRLAREERAALALLPVAASGLPPGGLRGLATLPWNERTTVRDAARVRNGAHSENLSGSAAAPDDDATLMLACVLSPAVRIDPWLLREARRRFLPAHDAELEAVLWFGPLVVSRGAEGIVLDGALLPGLRARLRDTFPALLPAALELVADAHAAYPATLRLEEQLVRLELEHRLDEDSAALALRPALKALASAEPDADDIAMWAAHAWGRLSAALRATDAARQLAFGAAARLQGASWMRRPGETDAPAFPVDVGWLLRERGLPSRGISVELRQGGDGSFELAFHEPADPTNALHRLELPDTRPLWLQAVDASGRVQAVAVEPGATLALDDPAAQSNLGVTLRTLAGDEYRLRVADSADRALSRCALSVEPRAEKSSRGPAPSPNVLMVARDLAIAWPDDGPEGEMPVLVDAEGRRSLAIRLGHLVDGLTPLPPLVSVFRLEDDGSGPPPWVALDPAGRFPVRSGSEPAPDVRHGLSWPNPGQFVQDPVRRRSERIFADDVNEKAAPSPLRTRGGLVAPSGNDEEWMLLLPSQHRLWTRQDRALIADHELHAMPFGAIRAAATELGRERWRACVLVAGEAMRGVAADFHVLLGKRLGPWRIWMPEADLQPTQMTWGSIEEALRRCDVVITIGPQADSHVMESDFGLSQQYGKPLLWVPLNAAAEDIERARADRQAGIEIVEPATGGRFDEKSMRDVVERIAAYRLPPAPGAAVAPERDAMRRGEPGWLDRVADAFRTRVGRQLEKRVPAPGLFQVSLRSDFALRAYVTPRGSEPLLILVHSLTSNAEATFGALWQAPAAEQRRALLQAYGERVFAFEHHAIRRSPVDNALQLAHALPPGATLHFLTHSAGGLIGELFARAQRVDGGPAFDERDLALYREGSTPESEFEMLQQLARVLADKRLRIERFVRIACPARGTRIFSDAPVQAFNAMNALSLLNPLAGLAGTALSSVFRVLQDPEVTPGFAMQHPASPLVRMLNRPDVVSDAPLTVVTGVKTAGGLVSRLIGAAADQVAFGNADNDLMVSVESARGGVPRRGVVPEFIDIGDDVDHFSYLQNTRSREAIVTALLSGAPVPEGFAPTRSGAAASQA